jgi:hypothetical protein
MFRPVWHYEVSHLVTDLAEGWDAMGNIGKEAPEIEVLPAEQPGPAKREAAPARPAPAQPAPATEPDPAPA